MIDPLILGSRIMILIHIDIFRSLPHVCVGPWLHIHEFLHLE